MSAITDLLKQLERYLTSHADLQIAAFLSGFDWSLSERKLDPRPLPVLRYLSGGGDLAEPECALASSLVAAAEALHWQQSYTVSDLGQDFLDRYGWVELFGTRGHFECADMAGGFLMLGPGIVYPDHHHVAEEIYIPLTPATFWSKDGSRFEERDAGEVVFHPSEINHAMKTEVQPLLALYLWRGGPLAQKPIMATGTGDAHA